MRTYTITIDEPRMQTLAGLIVAAGKSPATQAEVMMQAAEMMQWLQQQITAQPTGDNVVPMNKESTHG